MVPICFAHSLSYSVSVALASMCLLTLTFIHNELDGGANWAIRNLANGLAYAAFGSGATLIAGFNPHRLDGIAITAICVNAVVVATTIHA